MSSKTVYITAQGDFHHGSPECSGITGPHKTAVTQGYKVFEPEEVTLAEAQQRGKDTPCSVCDGSA
ncbi:hypothetical protein OG979_12840 [Actinomadura citrea]|uniref:hypothetical protein n=1 Tax=Actinomadura citrea TaxID=46158 RepID=UPI002E2B5237|nr:hypothetical protein [Actinomadura citrea]